jgi:hypothetical protein
VKKLLELNEWAEVKEVSKLKGAQEQKEVLGLKNYKLEELYENAKYNPSYCEELEAYKKNVEVLKAYHNLLNAC